jgi:hypothetical protein
VVSKSLTGKVQLRAFSAVQGAAFLSFCCGASTIAYEHLDDKRKCRFKAGSDTV